MSRAVAGADPAREDCAVVVRDLHYRYGEHIALDGVSFEVAEGEIFGVLGPNGGGKTTLFRILATLARPHRGRVELLGRDAASSRAWLRERIGVVFQSPSVDIKLSVNENLHYHGMLLGLRGARLRERKETAARRLGILPRMEDRVETLSGGLRRRVELAKGMLAGPRVLILDEPSTGLDPGARIDLWRYLRELRERDGTTILLTTHLMDEADRCDRLAILDHGKLVCAGRPTELRARIGGDVIAIQAKQPDSLARRIEEQLGKAVRQAGDTLVLEHSDGGALLAELSERFKDEVVSIRLSKPTLEDVFLRETGHRFWGDA